MQTKTQLIQASFFLESPLNNLSYPTHFFHVQLVQNDLDFLLHSNIDHSQVIEEVHSQGGKGENMVSGDTHVILITFPSVFLKTLLYLIIYTHTTHHYF